MQLATQNLNLLITAREQRPAVQNVARDVNKATLCRSQFAAPISTTRTKKQLLRSRTVVAQSANETSTSYAATVNSSDVKAILFDMDGVLCNSEIVSRKAAAEVMKELYNLDVDPAEFEPFTGMGEAIFLGGVASKYNAPFEVESCKAKFFEIYMAKYAVPGAGIGCVGARKLVEACRAAGLRTAVASSADRVKVDANLGAADIPLTLFDTIVSADLFEKLKPFPDIFLAAARELGVPPENCVVIEDAVAGVQAARAAGMRVIGVTTTLPPAAMADAAPDKIEPAIAKIRVDDLKTLKLRAGAFDGVEITKQSATQQQSDPQLQPTPSTSTTTTPWLEEFVDLPAGYKTTRRDALKFVSLEMAGTSFYIMLSRAKNDVWFRRTILKYHIPTIIQLGIFAYLFSSFSYLKKSLSYVSPKALLNALLPPSLPPTDIDASQDRIAAFKRFIADLEKRGGGQPVSGFPVGADWLNVAAPLKLSRELQGKVILLDFWAYCCINCMHVLPELASLEAKYEGKPVAVVGVHSAKFENEQLTAAIRSAVLRYGIRHPVVNDAMMAMWRELGVSSWPTIAVVSPQGTLITMLAGEGHKRDLDDLIAAALEYYGEQDVLNNVPLPIALEKDKDSMLASSPLRFPGKIAVDSDGGRLFISDSGNHRLIITDLQGVFIEDIGGNGPGIVDGDYSTAQFNRPQGVAFYPRTNTLFVADTESHALRAVDLTNKKVVTLAGDGIKGSDYSGGRKGKLQRLNSPWDVMVVDTNDAPPCVYIALAGQHQIWRHDLSSGVTSVFSGSGYERNFNSDSPMSTAWAQPSSLTLLPDKRTIVVADSESSSIRKLNLKTGGSKACVGGDPLFADNLFKFGDKDGSGSDALLQHPLAVAATSNGMVYVADSYNHRLKVLEINSCTIRTVAGTGVAGYKDDTVALSAALSEPGGLAIGPQGQVYICDTNNSQIRIYTPTSKDLGDGAMSTLKLKNVPSPRINPDSVLLTSTTIDSSVVVVKSDNAIRGEGSKITIRIDLPRGYHLTAGAGSGYSAIISGVSGGGDFTVSPAKGLLVEGANAATATITVSNKTNATKATFAVVKLLTKVYFCQDNDVCLFEEVVFEVPIDSSVAASNDAEVAYAVSAAAPPIDLAL